MTKIDYVNAWFYVHAMPEYHRLGIWHFPRFICADGFSVSIQAGEFSYSDPRKNDMYHYDEVELGFPSIAEPALMRWADEPANPTQSVYGYVPVDVVNNILEMHGIAPDVILKLAIADKRRKNEILQRAE
jgi:hypothetical protein